MGMLDRLRVLFGFRNGYDLAGNPKEYGLWLGGRDLRAWIEPEKVPAFSSLNAAWSYLKDNQTYITDEVRFGRREHWQSVEEYQTRTEQYDAFAGDCEDSTIWLLSALIKTSYMARGVVGFLGDWEKRRLRQQGKEEPYNHTWVMVPVHGKQWIMESTDKKAKLIRADVAPQYIPVYSWNRAEIFVHKEKR